MNYVIFLYFLALIISLLVLWFSGNLSVRYAIETSAKFKLTSLFVGFVLIAVSTGIPELSVVIASFFKGVEEISVGTILGSNICDISLVLGLVVLLGGTIHVKPKENKSAVLMLFITSLAMLAVFLLGILTKLTGIILILIYIVSIWWLWTKRTKKEIKQKEKEQKKIIEDGDPFLKRKWGVLLKLAGSIVLVLISSEFAVRFAIGLTNILKLSLETIGATIFAVGTSLPELSLGLHAVKKKEYSLALGNSLGSVLEQGTLLLGILAIGSGKVIDIKPLRGLAPFMFISFGIIAFGMIKRKRINRIEGAIMLAVFVAFMIYQLVWIR